MKIHQLKPGMLVKRRVLSNGLHLVVSVEKRKRNWKLRFFDPDSSVGDSVYVLLSSDREAEYVEHVKQGSAAYKRILQEIINRRVDDKFAAEKDIDLLHAFRDRRPA